MILKLRIDYESGTFDSSAANNTAIMTQLARAFYPRYIIPILTVVTGMEPVQSLEIEIDGSKDLTSEQWEYIKDKQYSLRFVQPLVLPEEEDSNE